MKKILLSISAVAAMIAMTATFSACSSDDEQQSSNATMIINASRGDYGGGTRQISLNDNDNIVTTWGSSDKVYAYKEGWTTPIGILSPDPNYPTNNNVTKLKGDISPSGLSVGSNIDFIMPRDVWDYTGQDGTIATISSKYDYATARVQVTFFDQNNKVYGTTAYFKTQQAIIKYELYYMDGTTEKSLDAKTLTIVSGQGKLVKSLDLDGNNVVYGGLEVTSGAANGTSKFYVALRNDYKQADTYTLTAKDKNGTIYTSTTSQGHTYAYTDYICHKVVMSAYDDTHTERDVYQNKVDQTW